MTRVVSPTQTKMDSAPVAAGRESQEVGRHDGDEAPSAKHAALHVGLLAELRLIRARLAIAVTELDWIGVAASHGLISTQQAIELSNPIIVEFADRSYEHDSYVEDFCTLVEKKRAKYERQQKRRRIRRPPL